MGKGKCKNIALTIEQKLKRYADSENSTERHKILWHEWNHNKKVLSRMQQLIYTSFPTYSMHDVSHSEAVLHNIEMILGKKNIKELSATDCFVILHTVYVHDIGMCITHNDKKAMFADTKFHKFLKDKEKFGDTEEQKYAKILLNCPITFSQDNRDKRKGEQSLNDILCKKNDIFYAIIFFVSEYTRREHGNKSKKKLVNWVKDKDKLGSDFSTIEIPSRIFYTVAECAATHTDWDFNAVLNLSQEDTGYVHDYFHPRFVAVLLQLGDALDLDNNRFHPLTEEFIPLPMISKMHFEKHESIRKLLITNKIIEISADCETPDAIRLIRSDWNGIDKILRNASYSWSMIRPENSTICLPTLRPLKLLLKGTEILPELIDTQFKISQERAFNLLKGNSIYEETKYVFLRELVQNAVDATKIQYFNSYQRIKGGNNFKTINPDETNQTIKADYYPIDIKFTICYNVNDEIKEVQVDRLEKNIPDENIGLLVEVSDRGIGINEKDLVEISNVGTSYSNRKEEIDQMPEWLQPTGRFGIGLQSVFICSNKLEVETLTRRDKQYNITFYPRESLGRNGYINAMVSDDKNRKYGSTFKVYIPYSELETNDIIQNVEDFLDPFSVDDENIMKIHKVRLVIKSMAEYVARLIEEPLFPITVKIYDVDLDNETTKELYDKNFIEHFGNVGLKIYSLDCLSKNIFVDNKEIKDNEGLPVDSDLTWAYKNTGDRQKADEDIHIHKTEEGHLFYLDAENAKVYIWDAEQKAYACFSSERILEISKYYANLESYEANINENPDKGIKIYYKGVFTVSSIDLGMGFNEDANLIEYIDFKNTLNQDYLNLNRKGFSELGVKYIKKVYQELLDLFRRALRYFSTGEDNLRAIKINKYSEENLEKGKIVEHIKKWSCNEDQKNNQSIDLREYMIAMKKCSENDEDNVVIKKWGELAKEQKRYIISVAALAYF